ncbi:hypothetical protein BPORC_1860 [Bifidobacterium porcinum]|nr:hypothetical protein BPORC_1860 [Bifidobacterium porcinum]
MAGFCVGGGLFGGVCVRICSWCDWSAAWWGGYWWFPAPTAGYLSVVRLPGCAAAGYRLHPDWSVGVSACGATCWSHGKRIPVTATSQSALDAPETPDVPDAPDDRAAVMSAQPQSVHPSLHVSQSARSQSAHHSKINLCYAEKRDAA